MSDSLPIFTMDEDEIIDLHGGLAAWLSAGGLRGAALDHALADTFRVACSHIEAARNTDARRRSSLSVVGTSDTPDDTSADDFTDILECCLAKIPAHLGRRLTGREVNIVSGAISDRLGRRYPQVDA